MYRLDALAGRIRQKRGDASGADAARRESARRIARLRDGMSAELRASFDGVPAVREIENSGRAVPSVAAR